MNISDSIQNGKVVIVDFYADWCGPCQAIAPILEKIAQEDSTVELIKIDIETDMELAREYKVRSVPTIFVQCEGKSEYIVGAVSEDKIKALISKVR